MKNIEIVTLYDVLKDFSKSYNKIPTRFAFKIARNISLLEPIVNAFREALDINNDEYLSEYYKEQRLEIEKACVKDGRGNPINKNNEFVFDDPKEPEKIVTALKEKYTELDEKIAEFNKKVQELGEEEEDITLYKVKLDDLPTELPANFVVSIIAMIEE